MRIISVRHREELQPFAESPLQRGFDAASIMQHAADSHEIALDKHGQLQARCSLWWRQVPPLAQQRLGVIGHYAAHDQTAATALLQHACQCLARQGCTLAVGPMDGNTWRRYRFITERGEQPGFFLEPDNPPDWPADWRAAGFTPNAEYFSALAEDLSVVDPRLARVEARLVENDVTLRPLNPAQFDAELQKIFAVSVISFRHNYLYTPLPEAEFLQQYRKVQPYVRPELTLLAEQAGEPIGFLFALPDMQQAQRGQTPDTVIIKTVAVLPGTRYAGLGALLVGRVQQIAYEHGYRRAIHALMFESNSSRNISRHYAKTMRRYTLFARELTALPQNGSGQRGR